MSRPRPRKGEPVTGWLNFFKPREMTSTKAVAIVKRLLHAEKAGHGGTLDPLADGVLPIALGEATKTVQWAMDARKEYLFTVAWGVATDSFDAEGRVTGRSDVRPTREAISAALTAYRGLIRQVPPAFSAIRVGGERAYDLARSGEALALEPRQVVVHAMTLEDVPDTDHAVIRAETGKGFYVRAMARDLARDLGTAAHVSQLQRIRVGAFDMANAVTLDVLEAAADPAARRSFLLPLQVVLGSIVPVDVPPHDAQAIRQGRAALLLPHVVERWRAARGEGDDRTALAVCRGEAVALGEVRAGHFEPLRVFSGR